jgi:hypothetical protein
VNKSRIIWPIVVVVAIVVLMWLDEARKERNYIFQVVTHSIGRELIETTNSQTLANISPELRQRLSELLRARTEVAEVLLGDDARSQEGGRASSRLFLTNELAESIEIRLRLEGSPGVSKVLSYAKVPGNSKR